MTSRAVALSNLPALERELGDTTLEALRRVADSGRFILGPEVAAFEAELAATWGVGRVVSCASGSDALTLALLASGVGPGDVVVTAPLAFIAAPEAIVRAGARPLVVDVEPGRLTLDPAAVSDYLARTERRGAAHYDRASGGRIAALLPVHLFGRLAALEPLAEIARAYGLALVEDAAQAVGARASAPGPRIGQAGAAAISFFPSKNLGCWGDGGAVVSDDAELAERVRSLRQHGRDARGAFEAVGLNSRLDALQSVVLRTRLPHLARWNERRRIHAAHYAELLAPLERTGVLALPHFEAGDVVHLYTVILGGETATATGESGLEVLARRSARRDRCVAELAARGVEARAYYPRLVCDEPGYCDRTLTGGPCPVARAAAASVLSLPVHAQLAPEDVAHVAGALAEVLAVTGTD